MARTTRRRIRARTPAASADPLREMLRSTRDAFDGSPQPIRRLEAAIGDRSLAIEFAPADDGVAARVGGDLIPGQKIPNQSEVATVGPFMKRIHRGDPEFATLVSNDNSAIVFKDEEGTGADRMMTPRLKLGLDTLATLVQREWPGVKLRVTEAWDENGDTPNAASTTRPEQRT